MQTQVLSLRERARLSFEKRKGDHKARLAFLERAQILDSNGNFDEKFFSEQTVKADRVKSVNV